MVAAVSGFLFSNGANITGSKQNSSNTSGGIIFLRIEFHLAALAERLMIWPRVPVNLPADSRCIGK
jgi:formyltetrahydrofolate hydrolase